MSKGSSDRQRPTRSRRQVALRDEAHPRRSRPEQPRGEEDATLDATVSGIAASNTATPPETDELREVFASVARYFSLLADPTRLAILHAICSAERSVSAIVEATGATQTNVSRHLALLHQAGIVGRRRDGSNVFYRLEDPEFAQICRMVCVRIAGRIEAEAPLRQDLLDYAAAR